jgi:hypothetical protein
MNAMDLYLRAQTVVYAVALHFVMTYCKAEPHYVVFCLLLGHRPVEVDGLDDSKKPARHGKDNGGDSETDIGPNTLMRSLLYTVHIQEHHVNRRAFRASPVLATL